MSSPETKTPTTSRFVTGETVPRDGFTVDISKAVPDIDPKELEKRGIESIVAEFGVQGATFALATAIKRGKGESGLRLVDGQNPKKSFALEEGQFIALPKRAGYVSYDETRGIVIEPIGSKQDLKFTGNVYGTGTRVAFDTPIIK